jgi:hypothetical protein
MLVVRAVLHTPGSHYPKPSSTEAVIGSLGFNTNFTIAANSILHVRLSKNLFVKRYPNHAELIF